MCNQELGLNFLPLRDRWPHYLLTNTRRHALRLFSQLDARVLSTHPQERPNVPMSKAPKLSALA